jgi:hypothetical protein
MISDLVALGIPSSTMNPETDDAVPERLAACSPRRAQSAASSGVALLSASSSVRKSHLIQRRLKEKISESRALELLERRIKSDRVIATASAVGDSNQNEQDQGDELVCDSMMVQFEAKPEETEAEPRACGVLKTVRGIHRQRERDRQPMNQ